MERIEDPYHPAAVISMFPFSRQSIPLHMSHHLKRCRRAVEQNISGEKEMEGVKRLVPEIMTGSTPATKTQNR